MLAPLPYAEVVTRPLALLLAFAVLGACVGESEKPQPMGGVGHAARTAGDEGSELTSAAAGGAGARPEGRVAIVEASSPESDAPAGAELVEVAIMQAPSAREVVDLVSGIVLSPGGERVRPKFLVEYWADGEWRELEGVKRSMRDDESFLVRARRPESELLRVRATNLTASLERPVPFVIGQTGLRLQLVNTRSLRGSIVLHEELPHNELRVAAYADPGDMRGSARVDMRGEFHMQRLPAGMYSIVVESRDLREALWTVNGVRHTAKRADDDERLQSIDLGQSVQLVSVHCTTEDGSRRRRIDEIVVIDAQDELLAPTDREGSQAGRFLAPAGASYRLRITESGYLSHIVEAARGRVEVQLGRGPEVRLEYVDWHLTDDVIHNPSVSLRAVEPCSCPGSSHRVSLSETGVGTVRLCHGGTYELSISAARRVATSSPEREWSILQSERASRHRQSRHGSRLKRQTSTEFVEIPEGGGHLRLHLPAIYLSSAATD